MDFSPNKTQIEIIKEDEFGGTYFRNIYSGINDKWYKNSNSFKIICSFKKYRFKILCIRLLPCECE